MNDVDELLSRLASPAPLRAHQIARIRAAIDDRRRPKRVPRFAIAGALCLALCGGAAAAFYGITQTREPEVAQTPVVPATEPPAPRHSISREVARPQPPPTITPAPAPAPPPASPPRTATSARVHAPAHVEPPAPPAPVVPRAAEAESEPQPATMPVQAEPGDAALAAESLLIATSLRELHKDHAARAALATLDRYAAEFPHGLLVEEARATRIEALMSLGDRHAALELLDAMKVGTELGVVRGELRLSAGRFDDAAGDFTAALIGARDDLEARALFGRAACRTHLGDRTGAREDLTTYLGRFPQGPQAAVAREALKGLSASRP